MKLLDQKSDITINVSSEAIIRTLVIILVAVFGLRFISQISYQLQLVGVSAFLALALNPAVTSLSKRFRIKSRILATGIAYLVVLAILLSFLALVVPPLVRQTADFVSNIPQTVASLKDQSSAPARLVQRYHLEGQIDNLSNTLSSHLGDIPKTALSTASKVGGTMISFLTILVLTFMMLVEGPLWLDRLWASMPAGKRKDYKLLAHKMYGVVTGYVNGQVLIATIAAVFAIAALAIATHVTHSSVNILAMGAIVFLFGLIPLIGNTLAAVIVVLVCLFASTPLALIMLVYFPIYQQIENATLQPHIQAKNNQLTPLIVFIAALVGAGFGGLLGAFVAIPAAGCLRIFLDYHFGKDIVPTKKAVDEKVA